MTQIQHDAVGIACWNKTRKEKRREKKEKDGQDTMPEKEESKPSLSADGTSDNMYEIPQRMSVNVLGLMS